MKVRIMTEAEMNTPIGELIKKFTAQDAKEVVQVVMEFPDEIVDEQLAFDSE